MYFSLRCQPLFLNTVFIVCVVFRSPWFFFFSYFNKFDKHLFTGISMVICKIGWSIRSWLSDYISFAFYKSYCRHDIYWILVAFMIAASALIKDSRLYGLYRHLYTQLIYCHCAVILYTHVNLLNKRFGSTTALLVNQLTVPIWDPEYCGRTRLILWFRMPFNQFKTNMTLVELNRWVFDIRNE